MAKSDARRLLDLHGHGFEDDATDCCPICHARGVAKEKLDA